MTGLSKLKQEGINFYIMKKNYNFIAIILFAVFGLSIGFVSCNKETDKNKPAKSTATAEQLQTGFTTVDDALIGYMNEGGQFVGVTELQLENFIKGIEFISSAGNLVQYGVIQGVGDAGVMQYALLARATDGEAVAKMSIKLKLVGEKQFAITEGGCSCKSTDCSSEGCNASKFGECSCSDCDSPKGSVAGSCEKTSSRFSDLKIASLF